MTWRLTAVCGLGVLAVIAHAQEKPAQKPEAVPEDKDVGPRVPLESLKDRASYSIGLNIGRSIQRDGLDLSADLIALGIKDVLTRREPLLNEVEVQETMKAFQADAMARQEERRTDLARKNLEEGLAFLEANEKKEGVKVLPSGLQYEILTEGTGNTPKSTDTVRTHYHGTLVDGTVFDSSIDRGEPAEFEVGGVIRGWTEALQLMPVGSKWRIVIPPELGYGERGAGRDIGPNAVLVFEVELLAIVE